MPQQIRSTVITIIIITNNILIVIFDVITFSHTAREMTHIQKT